jgi:hypothetical protein
MTDPAVNTYSGLITKDSFVTEMQAHRAADHFVNGNYFDKKTGKGCAIGCGVETINRRLGLDLEHNSHSGLANALGWPVWLCKMEDHIFEGLANPERLDWPVNLAIAVPEGASIEPALNQILARILREVVLPVAGSSTQMVQRVADGCVTNWVNDDPVAAAAYAANAANSNAAANAYAAAYAAANAAAYAVNAAANANAYAAAYAAANANAYAAANAANAAANAYAAANAANANAYAYAAANAANANAYAYAVNASANAYAYAVNASANAAAAWLAIAQIVLDEVGKT